MNVNVVDNYAAALKNVPIPTSEKESIQKQIKDIVNIYNKYDSIFNDGFYNIELELQDIITQVVKDIKFDFDFDDEGKITKRIPANTRIKYMRRIANVNKKIAKEQLKLFQKCHKDFGKERYKDLMHTYTGRKRVESIPPEVLEEYLNEVIAKKTYSERFVGNKDLSFKHITLYFTKFFNRQINFKQLIEACEQKILYADNQRVWKLFKDSTSNISNHVSKYFRQQNIDERG